LYNPANSERAWRTFFERYKPEILRWCGSRGLQPADREEVASAVLAKLVEEMRTFRYDPSGRFRSWLRTVVRNAVCDYLRSLDRAGGRGEGGSDAGARLAQAAAQESVGDLVEAVNTRMEADLHLLEEAERRVRATVQEKTWRAYELYLHQGRTGPEVAAELGLQPTTVYVFCNRILTKLRAAVAELKAGTQGEEPRA
jgi:RNA polymerase sigma factor (sigma-70 family)